MRGEIMGVYIQSIDCRVPKTCYSQSTIMERMKRLLSPSARTNRYINSIYQGSDIDQRYSCIPNPDDFFRVSQSGEISNPTTKMRNDLFTAEAKKLFVDVARSTIEGCPNVDFGDITHLVTVSCTGFFNPGPDYAIIEGLNLNKNVQRYNIGFMGCHAAFPALRLANSICRAEPHATVLVVSVELCTLHIQLKDDLDSILGGALFADGGAGAIVSAKKPAPGQNVFELKHFESTLIPDSRDEMAWMIGDTGFEMTLSQYIPKIIQSNIREIIEPILERQDTTISEIDHWAVHPGGKAILDRIEESLGIKGKCVVSRAILRQFGNMSSATILFVLKHILENNSNNGNGSAIGGSVLAVAFGPGLTVELAMLEKLTTRTAHKRTIAGVAGQLK
jgi:predicted naringenin-chalcone synthase